MCNSRCRPSAEKDKYESAAELGTEVIDDPKAATHAQEAVVHTNQGNGLRPCSPSAMRARLGGVRQPQECKV